MDFTANSESLFKLWATPAGSALPSAEHNVLSTSARTEDGNEEPRAILCIKGPEGEHLERQESTRLLSSHLFSINYSAVIQHGSHRSYV